MTTLIAILFKFKGRKSYRARLVRPMQNHTREPMFNISEKVPVWLAGLLIAIHIIAHYGPIVISNPLADWGVLLPLGAGQPDALKSAVRLIGHGFLHGSWGHVLMNSGMIVIFGVITMRGARAMRFSKGRTKGVSLDFLQVFLIGVIGGGLAQLLWWKISGGLDTAALGASGGASALFATTAWALGGKERLIGFGMGWALINAVMVFAGPVLGMNLAWAAHMGGYVAGAALAPILIKANSSSFGL